MKIAIPVNSQSLDTTICISYGRAPFYMVVDTQECETKFLENIAMNAQGGAGIKASQMLVDNGIEAIITMRCGENAAAVLQVANIQLYKAVGDKAMDNVQLLTSGKLQLLKEIHAGFHGHN